MSTPETSTSDEPADTSSAVSSEIAAEQMAADEIAADQIAAEQREEADAQAATKKSPAKAPAKSPAKAPAKTPVKPAGKTATKTAAKTTDKAPARKRTPRTSRQSKAPRPQEAQPSVLTASGLVKRFGATLAVDEMSFEVPAGSFFGIVGPNGAGKTTTMSMMTGLLRPDAGTISVNGIDVWTSPEAAKREMGVLPDRLRLFDRLTGWQLLHYSGTLRGLKSETVKTRAAELVAAFGLEESAGRLVADYSAGMTKKIALACAMIHAPRVLVLDEPFEAVDPVSAVNLTDILKRYVAGGGTVVLSSHSMELVQRECDRVVVIVDGRLLAEGTMAEVRAGKTLEERFIELAGGLAVAEGMEWLHSFSD